MNYYTLTETLTNDTETMTLLQMESKDKYELLSMFRLRRQMLLNATDARVLRDSFEEGFTTVMTENGQTINLSLTETTMV